MQASRSVATRERYRATQHDHLMYDAVEDDEYGQDAPLDAFGTSQVTKQRLWTHATQMSVCSINRTMTGNIRRYKVEPDCRWRLARLGFLATE